MAEKKEEKKVELEEYHLTLITTENKEIDIGYEIPADEDDYILQDIRKVLENNGILCLSEYVNCSIIFGETDIDELDFKKIIGIKW